MFQQLKDWWFDYQYYSNRPRIHKCPHSPSGYCEYNKRVDPARDDCLFCHQPFERK